MTKPRYLLLWACVPAGMALALWLRLGWIESADVAHRCLAGLDSAGCVARRLAILAFGSGGLKTAAAAGAVLAVLWKHPFSAWLAALAGGLALVLYSPETGAAALLVGSLLGVHLAAQARAQPGGHDRRGEQDVAQQP
jgi:hypothetical protein